LCFAADCIFSICIRLFFIGFFLDQKIAVKCCWHTNISSQRALKNPAEM